MIKLTYISVMIACLLISSHAFTFRNSEGYRDYNKKVFDAHNDARQNPKKYADFAEAQKSFFVYDRSGKPTTGICTDSDFVAKSTEWSFTLWTSEGVSAFDEAIDYLNNFKTPLKTLIWSESLSQSCFDHISDQGPKGTTGHYGSDGRSPVDRISVYTKYMGAGENLSYSDIKHPEDPVLQLLIDDGVPSRGHRANILKTDYTHLGVSCGCHKEYGEMCCFNYGTNITPKNPDLIAFAAPQLKTCSAYTASTPDATTGNVVLTPLTPVFASTEAPSTGSTGIFEIIGTTGSTEPTGSTGTTGSTEPTVTTETTGSITTPSESAITYSVSTSTDSDEIITKVYTINQTSAEGTTTYEFTWMGYDEADAPSINDVMGYFGIS